MTTPVRFSALLLMPLALAAPALAQEEGWSRFLPEIAPGIAACLDGEAGAAATAALPMNRGRVLVRITRRDGERLECLAELGAPGQKARREQSRGAGAAPPLPGEDAQRLSLAPLCPGATPVPQAAGLFLNPPGCR